MPDHTSWFTYLLALPGFRGLWAAFNHLGCVNTAGESVAVEAGGVCPADYQLQELPNHFTYPANTPVTLEYTTLAIFAVLIVAALTLILKGRIAKTEDAVVPEGSLTASSFVSNFVETFYGVLRDVMGKQEARYFLPIIGTCALFIFFSNALGMIPGFSPPTSNFNVTLACGLVIFVCTHYYGLRRQGMAYLKHFVGPIPWMAPLMIPLEIISHLVRPFSLAIRLCANMFVDHLLVSVFTGLFFLLLPLPVMLLGVLTVTLQTYVFCLLSTIYIQLSIEHHDDHDDHAHGHEGAHSTTVTAH
jgi:F-type H+-transporting ATPase subunit a